MKKIKFSHIISAITLALLSLGLGGLVAQPNAWADDNSSTITLSPMNQRIILTPGESYEGSIKVSNPSQATRNLRYSVHVASFSQHQDAGSEDDYGVVDTDTVGTYNQMMEWIVLGKEEGEIAPNELDVIPFTVNVPLDAPAGGQYATIIVKNETDQGSSGGNVMIQSDVQLASIIYAEVTGETHNEGDILSNSMPNFLLSNPLKATSMVENQGNVHTDASYVLQVWPLFSDEEVCTNEEDPSTSLVLPETKQYHVENCNLSPIGIYRARQTVKIFGETSVIERTIIICPIYLLFLILLGVCLIIFYFVKRAHDRRKRSV